MKVKILKGTSPKKLECEINEFIKDKCIINISHEIVTSNMYDRCVITLVVIILYDEYKNCGYSDLDSILDLKNKKTN
ncbi:MAG: hypothetical protein E7D28_07395 [Clostridium sp.]|jgi:hypothetical protein|uniref:Uncharacterized protein n=1 Tax=Clostridium tertium TaxID=1559 RepID=A0A9X3XKG3_9CLOT|nr:MULTISPECIES: hypothetical protein [Clostridium]EEH97090.1 hypothetical protein CSBG_00716 [Clostridium sp. 7_2_43FAA]MBS5306670.1 hypothetical protein [Clostridium sp.]MBU6134624.1 hypothetical protein [Clostridium tertium]MDB1931999.1 hypothetical protein [Clostridium tertium]MDB1935624.1 hypothetical protein [Clostridium tertium]